jgi:hypothetical protein
VENTEYTDTVMAECCIEKEKLTDIKSKISELTNGKAEFINLGSRYMPITEGTMRT